MNAQGEPDLDADLPELKRQLEELRQRVLRLEQFAPPDEEAKQAARVERVASVNRWESQLGGYWLSRLGIVSLITGTALLIITHFGELGPWVRVLLGYAIAAAIAYAGQRLARSHRVLGQVIFGGGLAIAYFVTYALHFVESVRILHSEPLGVTLVALAILGIVATAHRLQSETVAGVALFLALHTGMLTAVTALTLVCTTLLAAGAVFFVTRNRWVIVPLTSVVAVYSTHATWAYGRAGAAGDVALSLGFLTVDFLLFASAALIRPAGLRSRSVGALALLNWLGISLLGSVELNARAPGTLFAFLALLAAAHALLAAVAQLRQAPRVLSATYLGLSLLTLAIALPVRWEGSWLIGGWLLLALVAMAAAHRGKAPVFGWIALPILLAVLVQLARTALGWPPVLAAAVTFFLAERLVPDRATFSLARAPFVAGLAATLLMLSLETVPSGLQTLGWVVAGVIAFGLGFALHDALYRWSGFLLLALSGVRLLWVDLDHLTPNQRILTFLAVGVLLLAVSFSYARRRALRPPPEGQ